jgi:hypothetical protein
VHPPAPAPGGPPSDPPLPPADAAALYSAADRYAWLRTRIAVVMMALIVLQGGAFTWDLAGGLYAGFAPVMPETAWWWVVSAAITDVLLLMAWGMLYLMNRSAAIWRAEAVRLRERVAVAEEQADAFRDLLVRTLSEPAGGQ